MSHESTLPLTPHKREVGIAWFNGKTVQTRNSPRDGDNWRDYNGSIPLEFDLDDSCYRIKPEPKRRFWKPEEIPIGWQIRRIGSTNGAVIKSGGEWLNTGMGGIGPESFTEYEVAPPGPANVVIWIPAGVEE